VPQNADEVSEVVRSAAADGKRVAAQRTGHLAAPLSVGRYPTVVASWRLRPWLRP
jgi:hypothetical protein